MSVKIEVGPYRLESYSAGWMTGKPRVHESGKNAGVEYLVDQRYYGTLTQALTTLQDIWIRESSCESFDEVLAELKAFRAELVGLFAIEVREPQRRRAS